MALAVASSLPPDSTSFEILPERPQAPLVEPYHHWSLGDDTVWATFHRTPGGFLIRFPGLADFEIARDGHSAVCRPCPSLTDATREHLFLNQVHPLMLARQGRLVFHASAVAAGPGAVAFVAASGRGKSTLATAFAVAGARHLTDDGLAIMRLGDVHLACPGHPSIRLWNDSRAAVLDGEVTAADPVSYTSKVRLLSAAGLTHAVEPCRLAAAFFLGNGGAEAVSLRPLSGGEAVAAWVAHAFILDTEDSEALDRHFEEVAPLAERVPCYHLDYPRRYDALAQVRAAILDAGQTTELR